ncbi:MAG: Gfo/Idh/MocA family oxidoreductase [Armatimonadetes bacterium]|nr:Gfo/Idh/MocA family oxidoreductase [Armatimonadota bacterium]
MLRISLVSAATYGQHERTIGSFHGTAFSTAFNGWDEAAAQSFGGTFVRAGRRLEGARVVKVWDPDRDAAERLARSCHIDQVVDSPEAAAEGVDALIVVDDGSREQWRLALPALAKGLPVFIDKPLAVRAAEARAVLDFAAAHQAPVMSASSLRYVPDIQALRAEAGALGNVSMATTICGNELVYYGIHALEMAYEVLGDAMRGQARSVLNVGQDGRNICRVRYASGLDLVLMVAEGEYMQASYQLSVFGRSGWRTVQPDLTDLYYFLLERFLDLVRGGQPPVSIDEMHEVIAVLEAGKRSLAIGAEVDVRAVLAERQAL